MARVRAERASPASALAQLSSEALLSGRLPLPPAPVVLRRSATSVTLLPRLPADYPPPPGFDVKALLQKTQQAKSTSEEFESSSSSPSYWPHAILYGKALAPQAAIVINNQHLGDGELTNLGVQVPFDRPIIITGLQPYQEYSFALAAVYTPPPGLRTCLLLI